MSRDQRKGNSYKDSLNLPRTEFPMRGDLARTEPELLAAWDEMGLYRRIQQARANAPLFVLHDGPPYSNGHLHYGHVLNKVLKDIIIKYRTMAGHRTPYVPGWDTHGLPIELAVTRGLAAGTGADAGDDGAGGDAEPDAAALRAACREYALEFVDIQREEFRRLGVFGAWDTPYLTLDPGYEAAIVRALAAFARGGYLYRGDKPVYWCASDRTALAEAEIEYRPHTSPSIYVRFPMDAAFDPAALDDRLAGARLSLAIWTTTPWTLPANLAIVVHPRHAYVALPVPARHAGGAPDDGDDDEGDDRPEYLLCARELASAFVAAGTAVWADDGERQAALSGAIEIAADRLPAVEGARYRHPFVAPPDADADADAAGDADNRFRVWFAEYVTLDQGTGLVHTAPGHGADDYATGAAHDLPPYSPIDDAGRFTADVPQWAGQTTAEANPAIVRHLHDTGYLVSDPAATLDHTYPHCWRCKHPILFRATPQWFLRIDHHALRRRALDEIALTRWLPTWGQQRIHGMIEGRPDWCISRQRAWGVPIPVFYCRRCETAHADAAIMEHVAEVFAREGSDAWYTRPAADLVPAGFACGCGAGPDQLVPERDIVDVWFESGCSWFAVALAHPDHDNIDVYVEGSDQHRGWFHSSLLVGIGVRGKAPYKAVLTHGWVLDESGRPYSKSEIAKRAEQSRAAGATLAYVPPAELCANRGAELLRLWVGSTDYRGDIPYSEQILAGLTDWYRKLRNTCRFMLGNLHDFAPDDNPLESAALTELDRYMLARLGDLCARTRASYDRYEFHAVHRALVDFVTVDLSALYLDAVKDRLYTEAWNAPARRAAQCVLYTVVRALALIAAPITCFLSEEIWRHLPHRAGDPDSVHLAVMPEGRRLAYDDPLAVLWDRLLGLRKLVSAKLEAFRADKNRSLDARVTLAPTPQLRPILADRLALLAELFIVSDVRLADTDAAGRIDSETDAEPVVTVEPHPGVRCERCWRWFDAPPADGVPVTTPPEGPAAEGELCARCERAMAACADRP